MRSYRKQVTYTLAAVFLFQTIYAPRLYADPILGRIGRLFTETHYHGTPPNVCQDGDIEFLAENIDWLEHHIDKYGSIVAKHPDIWGEARLTKHRDEYERQMYRELNQYSFKINAAIAQSDSSFLAQAFALSSAATGSVPQITAETGDVSATTNSAVIARLRGVTDPKDTSTFANFADLAPEGNGKIGIEPVLDLDQRSRYLQHLHELRRINEGDDTSDSPGYSLNLVRIPVSILPGKMTREGFGAEITVTATPLLSDDLLPNTFRNLVVNDLVDQLGLPIVRSAEQVPESKAQDDAKKLLKEAKANFANPTSLSEDELKQVVKGLLDNKYVRSELHRAFNKIALYVACIDENKAKCSEKLAEQGIVLTGKDGELFTKVSNAMGVFKLLESAGKPQAEPLRLTNLKKLRDEIANYEIENNPEQTVGNLAGLVSSIYEIDSLTEPVLKVVAEKVEGAANSRYRSFTLPQIVELPEANDVRMAAVEEVKRQYERQSELRGAQQSSTAIPILKSGPLARSFFDVVELVLDESTVALEESALSTASTSTGRIRRATNPVPSSQVADVYGQSQLKTLAEYFYDIYYGRYVRWAGQPYHIPGQKDDNFERRVDLLDAQKWLGAELSAAYELLSEPDHLGLWYQLANPESGLAKAIRSGHIKRLKTKVQAQKFPDEWDILETPESLQEQGLEPPVDGSVEEYRKYFFDILHSKHFNVDSKSNAVLNNLAWTIVVESALLNQRLNEDIRKTFTSKGCYCGAMGDVDLAFFLPEAAAKQDSPYYEFFAPATQAFQEYVKCRWPIHVFAIDPREQDQNVADVSARKRELQFALAIGFVSGQIGGNSLTQYSRDLQTQIETISLNRTVAGFSHGTDTFGWRFYPRVQALDIPGTAGAIKETIFGVSRDCDLHKRQLEPGMRECVAVVLMPSFVPYADFDVRSNWFSLTNPKNAALTMKDTVHLSKAITAMRRSRAQCARCAECYRPGEVERMMTRIEQLDRELPLQSMRAQVPYENTLGGFEMFNTGVTDLAPELVGWYGAPGVVVQKDGTPYSCGCNTECAATDIEKAIQEHVTTAHSPGADGGPTVAKAELLSNCEGTGTTLFLVGDNFSVHDTKVIAGGVCIPHVRLISREIMQVTIPSCVNTVKIDDKDYVAVYAATPYGITNHLHVPIHCRCGEDALHPSICNSCQPSEEQPSQENQELTSNDSTTFIPIPLPRVEDHYAEVSYMNDEPVPSIPVEDVARAFSAMEELAMANRQVIESARTNIVPAEFVVNVQSTEVSAQTAVSKEPHCSGPVAKQMKTRFRECWHNLRDLLPCN